MNLKVGDKVETCVYVAGKRVAMHKGIIVGFDGIHETVARVDIASLRGCAPWIVRESTAQLQKVDA